MKIEYNHVTYIFPDEALTGTDASVIEADVVREEAGGACGDGLGADGACDWSGASRLTYRIYSQRRQGSRYLAAHGCSLCALSTLIGAFADPSVTPTGLEEKREALIGRRRLSVAGRRLELPGRFPTLPGRLARARRMPLNIAGLYRISSLFMKTEFLDETSEELVRAFILERASRGIPVLATGKGIPSLSGSPLCPHSAHSFLIIGMKDPSTLIVADSAGLNDERVKFVDIDHLVPGLLRRGAAAALKKRQYYYNRLRDGGLISPREL